jgi:hypothetical protein
VSFAAITLCVASQRVFIVAVVYFVIDSVRKFLDTHSYVTVQQPQERSYSYTVQERYGHRTGVVICFLSVSSNNSKLNST